MSELYTEFFGLNERPFTLQPDPDFLFWSRQHVRAFSVLEYGIVSRAPITIITGDIGAGKTTLLQKLLGSINDEVRLGLVSNATGNSGGLLHWVLNSVGIQVDPATPHVTLFQTFQDFLIEEYAAGRRVILIFDEAQNLNVETLEELRMLTNVNSNKDELLQLVLVGQPELRDLIARPEMRQFAQRVTANYHLKSMDRETTSEYISHRLKIAGGTGEEFTEEARARIYDFTEGVPRLVNQLADFCMVYAMADEDRLILTSTVDQVLGDGVFYAGFNVEVEAEE